jgi:putative tricarboxylic transport membrane protein
MRLPDRVTGLLLVGLGGAAAYGGSLLPPVPGQQVGPNVFPMVVGLGLCLCGVLIALGVGRRFEDEAEDDLAAIESEAEGEPEGETVSPPKRHPAYGLRALLPPALLLFYVFAVDRIGFIPTAMTIIFVAAVSLGARLRLAAPVALLAPIVVHLVFYKLLRVPLPDGWLPMPW